MRRWKSRCCIPGRSRSRSSFIWRCRCCCGRCCATGGAARLRLPVALIALSVASFALCVWLMKTDRSATAFFMSPPRAWEFLIGGIVAVDGFPVLRNALRAADRARDCAGAAGDSDLFAAAGAGLSRRQRAAAVHRCGDVHLERHRRADAVAEPAFAAQRHKILRPDFLFAVSLALAAVHLRAVFQKQPGARCRSTRWRCSR